MNTSIFGIAKQLKAEREQESARYKAAEIERAKHHAEKVWACFQEQYPLVIDACISDGIEVKAAAEYSHALFGKIGFSYKGRSCSLKLSLSHYTLEALGRTSGPRIGYKWSLEQAAEWLFAELSEESNAEPF